MLFVSLGQWGVFLAFCWLGAMLSLFYEFFDFKNIVVQNIISGIYFFFSGIAFIIFMHYYNLGQFRFFLIFGVVIGIVIEKIFMSKIVADIKKILYNCISKQFKIFKSKFNFVKKCNFFSKAKKTNAKKIKNANKIK